MQEEKAVLEKLEIIENKIDIMQEDIDKIYDRLDLRDQYLQMLTVIHDNFKTFAFKLVFKE